MDRSLAGEEAGRARGEEEEEEKEEPRPCARTTRTPAVPLLLQIPRVVFIKLNLRPHKSHIPTAVRITTLRRPFFIARYRRNFRLHNDVGLNNRESHAR